MFFQSIIKLNTTENTHFKNMWVNTIASTKDVAQDYNIQLRNQDVNPLRHFIQTTKEAFVSCNINPEPFQYCQSHYLVVWDSISRNYTLYHKTPLIDDEVDFSIASHTSVNRLSYLPELEKRWNGPISLSIFVKISQLDEVNNLLMNSNMKKLRTVLYIVDESISNCIYRSQWNETLSINKTYCLPLDDLIYPINTLRNLAIQNIQTSHFLNLDMDMWPSYRNQMNVDRTAFVLPAFQFTLKEREICNQVDDCLSVLKVKIPSNKTELLQCMREGVCQIANARLPTHRFISTEWWTTNEPIQKIDCMPFKIMEPYVVMKRTEQSPMYDDNFINYGYNKVQFIDHLQYRGYIFHILTIGFGFDIPHKPSVYANKYEESWRVKNVVNADVYQDFLQRLEREKNRTRQSVCNREMALKVYRSEF